MEKGIFGPKRNEVTGVWKKLHNEELHDLYSSPTIMRVIKSRGMRWAGHVVRMGERKGVCRVSVGKPEGKRPLGRHRRKWEDYIKMDIQEVGCGGMDLTELAQDRDRWRAFVNTVMNILVPKNAGNFLTSCKPVSFSRRTVLHGVSNYGKGGREDGRSCSFYLAFSGEASPLCFQSFIEYINVQPYTALLHKI
jgi:hypothetical protein